MDQEVRHVVVEVAGTDTARRVLRRAGQEAVRHRARLCPVLLHPPGPGGLRPPLPQGEPLEVWTGFLRRLDTALGTALGGLAATVECDPLVAWGCPGPAMVAAAEREGHGTLLVIPAAERGLRHRHGHLATARYCLKHWPGPLLLVPTDQPEEPHGERGAPEAEALIRGPATACHGTAISLITGGGGRRA
ncbi:universal stress protein [Streptomyces sp. NPDC090442]|uniref:universal stress protein n=1 Tax=Streptomyces sp. NPDC090442 TaxID=3365962 RepID=UPI00381D8F9E